MKKYIAQLVCLGFALVAVSGCATGRYIASPSDLGAHLNLKNRDAVVEVELKHIIIPNGPGAWLQEAKWDEYIFQVRNYSSTPVTIESIKLVGPSGRYMDNSSNPETLEKLSEKLLSQYEDAGVAVAIYAAPGVAAAGAVAAGSVAGVAAAAVLAPVAAIAAPLYYWNKTVTNARDKEDIEAEFRRRRVERVTISGNATLQGSAFYPILPSPRALIVNYRQGEKIKTVQVPLERLKLHVAG